MTDEFDWLDLDHNSIAVSMPTELLDRMQVAREIDRRMTEAFLTAADAVADAALGDLDNWKPVGLLPHPAPGVLEQAAREWAIAEFEMNRDDRNARAVGWWRSQRLGR